jgi:hypothetical protein
LNSLAKSFVIVTFAVSSVAVSAIAQAQATDGKTEEVYQTLYLTNLSHPNDANEVTTVLRNMLPKAKMFYVASQSAISMKGTPEDIALARKILADMDKTKKIYRLTFTMTERDGEKTIGVEHLSLVVASGSTTVLKQGSRVPVGVGGGTKPEVNYLDIGEEIEASLDGYFDGARLRTKVVQSSIAEDKSWVGTQDPVIRQTTLEGTSTLIQGKPLVLGSLDIPGSTRRQEIEVISELVR